MPDNIATQTGAPATLPSDTTIATDEVAGVHYQRVKLVDATLDSTGPIGVQTSPLWVRLSDGAAAFVGQKVMAASLPVAIASDQAAVPVSAASLPLPSGAAQDETLQAIRSTLNDLAFQSFLAAERSLCE